MQTNKSQTNIPVGWQHVVLVDICKVNQGLQIPISERFLKPGKNRKLYITTQYLNGKSDAEYIENYSKNVVCQKDEILMTRTGNSGVVITGVEGVFHNNFFKVKPLKNIDGRLLVYNLLSPYIQYKLLKLAGASTIPDLNHGDFYSIDLLLPPLPEQHRIVTILETWDQAIEKLTKKIELKKQIKKGLMGELLTGKRRLRGGSGEWTKVNLGKCLLQKPDYGINAASVEFSNQLPAYLRITDISEDGLFLPEKKTSVNHLNAKDYILDEGDIVFARTGASVGKTYLYNKKDGQLVFAGFLIRARANKSKVLPAFISAYSHTEKYWKWVKETSPRSGQPGINSVEFASLTFDLPPLPEQTQIVAILETYDQIIEKLEKKRHLLKSQKTYLLNNLITGKLRTPETLSGKMSGIEPTLRETSGTALREATSTSAVQRSGCGGSPSTEGNLT